MSPPAKEAAWTPSSSAVESANVTRLMRAHGIFDLEELRRRSLDPDWFWPAVLEDLDIRFDAPYGQVVETDDGPQWARWFVGGRLNLAATCLDRWAEVAPRRSAVSWRTEVGESMELDYGAFARMADGAAAGLRTLGVEAGDTVGIFMPLAPHTAAALYGCWKLGAIAVPIFSGFGAEAVARRLIDADACVLVTVDSFVRRGTEVAMKEVADEAIAKASQVEHVLVCRRGGPGETAWNAGRDVDWSEVVPTDPERTTTSVAADHPALLIYTSGSTGRPKGALLTHAGMLVNIAKDAAYHLDLGAADRLLWVTDIGWIMGAWEIVAAGALGASVCLVEGAPATPSDRLWNLVESQQISVLGVSPSLIRGLAAAGAVPGDDHNLGSLRVIGATGEPWSPAAYDWLLDEVGRGECPIINISGGSEVGGCFLAPTPVQPLESCSLGGPALGMDMAVFDEAGEPVGPGEVGELVCRRPWPGMTKGLWRDPERFIETYWSRFPGVWVHGDWASFDEAGQWFLHGRSDDTLNIGGQRIGPAEAEAALTALSEVSDAAAIAMSDSVKGQVMWCFAVPAGSHQLDPEALADTVAAALGKPFRPARVLIVDDLPRTRSQKILRRAVRAIAEGSDAGDLSSLENPAALDSVAVALGTR